MKHLRYLWPLLLFFGIALLLWKGLQQDPRKIASPLLNKPVPVFKLQTISSAEPVFSNEQLKQHISLLNVWATWCQSCRNEHPILMDIARSHEVTVYGLAYKDDAKDVEKWLAELGNPYAAVGLDTDGKVAIDWGVYGTPETFVIDQQGIIRYKHVGTLTNEVWHDKLLPMIKKLQSVS